jgi:hypothetical protein
MTAMAAFGDSRIDGVLQCQAPWRS